MTITCKKCEVAKTPSFYRPSDIKRKANICRACRGTLGNPRISPGSFSTCWRTDNARFFAEGRAR